MRDGQRSKHERARPVLTTKVSFAKYCRGDRGKLLPVLTAATPAQANRSRRELLPFGIYAAIVIARWAWVKPCDRVWLPRVG